MKRFLNRLFKDEAGQGLAEYGLILALVAVAVIVALGLLGEALNNLFNNITDAIEGKIPGAE